MRARGKATVCVQVNLLHSQKEGHNAETEEAYTEERDLAEDKLDLETSY